MDSYHCKIPFIPALTSIFWFFSELYKFQWQLMNIWKIEHYRPAFSFRIFVPGICAMWRFHAVSNIKDVGICTKTPLYKNF